MARNAGDAGVPATVPGPAPGQNPAGAGRELEGRRAVVTGSSSGIGRAIALELAAAGAGVLVHARRSVEAAAIVRRDCEARGVEAQVIVADLGDPRGRRFLVEKAWENFPRIDIWVNNAGADILTGDARKLTFEEKLALLWKVDVEGTVHLSREAGKRMHGRGGGLVVNIGWDQAASGMAGESGELFAAVKGAVMAFSRSLALSLAPDVRVNCIAPGWIRTAWGKAASEPWQERVVREIPLERWGTPEDIARTVRFLASPGGAFITGQVIAVNGGAVRL